VSDYDDDNIEFDFFEEPAPEPEQKRGLPRRPRRPDGPSRPPVRPGPGLIPMLRLLGLIAAAIAVVLLVAEIGGCSSTSDAYKHYLTDAKPIADRSAQEGTQLSGILAQSSVTETTIERTLGGLVTTADKLIQDAQALSPPGPLRDQHEDLLDSLRLRRAALAGLLQSFKRTAHEKKDDAIGTVLAEQTNRLAASDVLWRDLFQTASGAVLQKQGVHGVEPPASVFLAKPATLDAKSLGNLWKRVHGSAVASNVLRGTALEGVVFKPGDKTPDIPLARDASTTLLARPTMRFVVSVKDTGDSQEANIKVRLTIEQAGFKPLTKVIPVMNPGDIKPVIFVVSGAAPLLNQPLKVDVNVEKVPHEASLDNNSHQYTVYFQV
jgi:hypothetical protein